MSSIKDVARTAGVSTATVSRVLANKDFIRPTTRARVLQAVADLGYRPNLVARSLRAQRSTRIGLVFSDIRNPFFASLSRSVEDAAYARGYSVLICNTDEDPQKEAMYLELLHDENVAGIIFSPTQSFGSQPLPLPVEMPVVVIDRTVKGQPFDTVVLDNVAAAYELTEHLVANGYTRLAGIFGDASTTGQERCRGFQDALKTHGLEPLSVRFASPRTSAGYLAASQLLDEPALPDAVLASNALLLGGAFKAMHERHLRIPQDVALAGFDLTEWSELVDPPITVMAQPIEEIGCAATELLFQRLSQAGCPAQQVILKGKLLARGSTSPRQA
jgi:LacI family fructose operon transcriptional repressor